MRERRPRPHRRNLATLASLSRRSLLPGQAGGEDRSFDIVGRIPHDGGPATELHAHLVGVTASLELLATQGVTAPIVLRLSDPAAAACVAGAWVPRSESQLRSQLQSLLKAARARCGRVWVAGYDPHRRYPFGERAAALAHYSEQHLPPNAVPGDLPDPPWSGNDAPEADCPVCMQDFTSLWPAPDAQSRAPPRRWHCQHAVCRECDAHVQQAANSKCPLCRALRRVTMQP